MIIMDWIADQYEIFMDGVFWLWGEATPRQFIMCVVLGLALDLLIWLVIFDLFTRR